MLHRQSSLSLLWSGKQSKQFSQVEHTHSKARDLYTFQSLRVRLDVTVYTVFLSIMGYLLRLMRGPGVAVLRESLEKRVLNLWSVSSFHLNCRALAFMQRRSGANHSAGWVKDTFYLLFFSQKQQNKVHA